MASVFIIYFLITGVMYHYNYSVFYDPKEYYMDPEDLPSTKYGGVAVLKGKKVTTGLIIESFIYVGFIERFN